MDLLASDLLLILSFVAGTGLIIAEAFMPGFGIAGISGVYFYEKAGGTSSWIALLIALVCYVLVAGLGALIFSVLTITLRANQNVVGLAMTTFGVGVGNFFGGSLIKLTGSAVPSIALSTTSGYFSRTLPFAKSAGAFGKRFTGYDAVMLAGNCERFL